MTGEIIRVVDCSTRRRRLHAPRSPTVRGISVRSETNGEGGKVGASAPRVTTDVDDGSSRSTKRSDGCRRLRRHSSARPTLDLHFDYRSCSAMPDLIIIVNITSLSAVGFGDKYSMRFRERRDRQIFASPSPQPSRCGSAHMKDDIGRVVDMNGG